MSLRFGAYEILHELKAGGMGAVLLGRRRGPGTFEQLVAIKTIRTEYASTPAVRAMFLDEAAIVARINHPVIATVHDFGDQDGTLYMVMEYVAGNSFRTLSDRPVPPTVAARAIAEACRGLHAAHEVRDTAGTLMGVVHRDISPDNLMLGFDGHVKVIDFGIALVRNRQSPVTELGTVKGKPPYMSPEQVKNESIDRRSDVFSLGVVLHELLTGLPLFEGESIYAVARAVEHQEIRAPSIVRGEPLPHGLDAAVMRALDRNLATRTPSAAALAEELERVIANTGDESLEAWAERELALPRDAHRAWIAGVVRGTDAPGPMGRPTGSVTAVAPMRPPVREESAAVAPVSDDEEHAPARRRSVLPLLIGVFALATVISLVMLQFRSSSGGSPVDAGARAVPDAAVIAIVASDAAVADAGGADAGGADAGAVMDAGVVTDGGVVLVARDAGTRRGGPRDAGTLDPRTDVVKQVAIDAAVASGAGQVSFRARRGSYVNVTLDGQSLGPTPIFKHKVSAGPHTVEMRDPVGNLVHKATFVIDDGELENITQP